jgi:hypothetical protein
MTNEEAIELIKVAQAEVEWSCPMGYAAAFDLAIKALEQTDTLDKIRAEIGMYEADCRLQGGTDECGKCNSNVFGSIYRIIDKYKAESEDKA